MKCSMIRDLLPIYCDGLASPDSCEEIEKHLAGCEECREVYDDMKKELDIHIPERDIKPLKAVKKRNRLNLILSVISTAAVLSGLFLFVFWGIIPIDSARVHYTAEVQDNVPDSSDDEENTSVTNRLWLDFDTDTSCCRFSTTPEYINDTDGRMTLHDHLYIYPQVKLPFDNRGKDPGGFSLGFEVHEGDTLTIHYIDKEENIDLYQLYTDRKNS
ncbi:MAG: zf-HC2 domain-containing protein [Oscillospiraceae bacterium]|nr:zf-HC2 domain-containing protein [Oscillospiraceae bacterium]